MYVNTERSGTVPFQSMNSNHLFIAIKQTNRMFFYHIFQEIVIELPHQLWHFVDHVHDGCYILTQDTIANNGSSLKFAVFAINSQIHSSVNQFIMTVIYGHFLKTLQKGGKHYKMYGFFFIWWHYCFPEMRNENVTGDGRKQGWKIAASSENPLGFLRESVDSPPLR